MADNKETRGPSQGKRKKEDGFTLVELAITIVVLGFCLLSLVKVFGDLSVGSVRAEYRNAQNMLAQELLEEIKSRRFDELNATVSGNWSTTLGVNYGETSTNKNTFDDADDFNGWNENLASPFSGFSRAVSVCYVNSGALNTCLTIPSPVPNDWTPRFKRVRVTVSKSGVPDLQLATIVSTAKT